VVLVEPVLPALVEVDGFALQRPDFRVLALLLAGLLELRQGLLAGSLAARSSSPRSLLATLPVTFSTPIKYVGDLRSALEFLFPGAGEEAAAHQVALLLECSSRQASAQCDWWRISPSGDTKDAVQFDRRMVAVRTRSSQAELMSAPYWRFTRSCGKSWRSTAAVAERGR